MARDPLKEYLSGERLTAATVNALLRGHKNTGINGAGASLGFNTSSTRVLIRNAGGSSEDVDWYGVLGIDGLAVTKAENEDEFMGGIVLDGVTPEAEGSSSAGHSGKFAIVQQPIASGEIGVAVIAGATQVQINVTDADHKFADIKDGDNTQLESAASGSARILWKESGTGTKWAVVCIGASAPSTTMPVICTKDGGTNGDATNAPTWTFTGVDLSGNTLFTGKTPDQPVYSVGLYIDPSTNAQYGVCWADDAADEGYRLLLVLTQGVRACES